MDKLKKNPKKSTFSFSDANDIGRDTNQTQVQKKGAEGKEHTPLRLFVVIEQQKTNENSRHHQKSVN